MTTIIEQLTDLQAKVLDLVDSAQEPVVGATKQVIDKVEGSVPELPSISGTENLPALSDLIDNQFDFVVKVLDQQRAFIQSLLDAVRPVSAKLVADEADAA